MNTNKIFNNVFFIVSILAFALFAQTASARNYSYDSIETKININQDSTFDVEEAQIFNYIGEYHVGWRSVSLNKIDGISNIEVINGETGQILAYSSKRLDKLSPASWGKFTYFKNNGMQNIEWYYNLSDTSYKWIIKYKVHGGIGFFPSYDELYWNIFTDYDTQVKDATVKVTLPTEINDSIIFKAYRTDVGQNNFIDKSPMPDKRSFLFEAKDFKPYEDFTIQLGWPKGLVSQSAYWQDFLGTYIFYILAILITLINIFYIVIHWYFKEVRPVSSATIIPQYVPPENLRPAMAEVLLKEKVTDKGWSATVIDLAVRGFIKIKEDKTDWMEVLGRVVKILGRVVLSIILLSVILLGAFLIFGFVIFDNFWVIIIGSIIIWIFYIRFTEKEIFGLLREGKFKEIFVPKNYILEKIDNSDESDLVDYEKKFLHTIFMFGSGTYFSTSAMKKSGDGRKRQLYEAMKKLKEILYSETTTDTGAFEIGVEKGKIGTGIFLSAIAVFLVVFGIVKPVMSAELIFILVFTSNVLLLYICLNYEARLSQKGFILKEDWLGFKMYLETAERYRIQNLTPETFEKYLPYAIIFGIEKKWGKVFESFNIQNPSWYSGTYVGYGTYSRFSSGGGFSPYGFSASFSSSFSSAFSSAGGAGGGGGGGGGAGGGGGGGGGGAG